MKLMWVFVTTMLVIHQRGYCNPTKTSAKSLTVDQYLNRYGYMAQYDGPPPEDKKRKAIEVFQAYAKIPVTGVMDEATTKMLTGPRCGESDRDQVPPRLKRFVKQGTQWKKLDLSYSVHGTPRPASKITSITVRDTLAKSFKMWKDVSKLSFRRLADDDNSADIIIKFAYGSHGDLYAFDGNGGTLAHGFYPGSNTGIAGDIHFDNDEIWTINGEEGTTDYTWTALHEIGHSLGLRHSHDQDAIMWPWFTGYKANTKLTQDDINGIQAIYGKPTTIVPTKKTKSPVCNIRNFDAIFYDKTTRVTYFLKGKYVWQMNEKKVITKQELISRKWPGLESDVDSAYQRPTDNDIVFFKGNRFWRYRGTRKVEGPSVLSRYIEDHRKMRLNKIHAVMVWKIKRGPVVRNSLVYFFTGKRFWRYDESKGKIGNSRYPRKSSLVWHNVPFPVDSILTWKNDKTYFFKNGKAYKYKLVNKNARLYRGNPSKKHFIPSCRG